MGPPAVGAMRFRSLVTRRPPMDRVGTTRGDNARSSALTLAYVTGRAYLLP